MEDSKIIVVCDKCLQASCIQGIFMCDESRSAGETTRTVAELKKLGYEHSDYWKDTEEI